MLVLNIRYVANIAMIRVANIGRAEVSKAVGQPQSF